MNRNDINWIVLCLICMCLSSLLRLITFTVTQSLQLEIHPLISLTKAKPFLQCCIILQLRREAVSLTETGQFIFHKFTQEFAEQQDGNSAREWKGVIKWQSQKERNREGEERKRVINVSHVARSSRQHPARKGQAVEMRPPLFDHASFRQWPITLWLCSP